MKKNNLQKTYWKCLPEIRGKKKETKTNYEKLFKYVLIHTRSEKVRV